MKTIIFQAHSTNSATLKSIREALQARLGDGFTVVVLPADVTFVTVA